MTWIDMTVFLIYLAAVLAVGAWFYFKNTDIEDYYVGGRQMGPMHVGMSIVATDVGGGFSIGLGGLGFSMGLSGSWLLFTGLVGAWLSAVLIIPRIKALDSVHGFYTYPDFLRYRYGETVAICAALISALGYIGFTGGQILAGAKLSSATLITGQWFGLSPMTLSLLLIAFITILYTVLGGIKAVIYTDTVQWIVLLAGLLFIALPISLWELGGFAGLAEKLPAGHFSLFNLEPVTALNWMITIIPIWLVGMTLYQRMFACRNEREAKQAWYIAGLLEYPLMAFSGVLLGMCARVWFPMAEAEMGLPMLIREVLPVGIRGIVIAAYFSAIMSTADSCLMAASGNVINDLLQRKFFKSASPQLLIRLSQLATLLIGVAAVLLASSFTNVLEIILHAYGFMVAGLFIPTLGAYFWKGGTSTGALAAIIGGGSLVLLLQTAVVELPVAWQQVGLDPAFYGIILSALLFVGVSWMTVPGEGTVQSTGTDQFHRDQVGDPGEQAGEQHGRGKTPAPGFDQPGENNEQGQ